MFAGLLAALELKKSPNKEKTVEHFRYEASHKALENGLKSPGRQTCFPNKNLIKYLKSF